LLAAAFSAAVALQIQQAHFFTMDTFTTLFSTLALYCAVRIATSQPENDLLWPSLGFGVALGMAVASKINTVAVAVTLPGAMLIYLARVNSAQRERRALRLLGYLALAAALSVIVFRIFQPYAFSGPGFFGLKLNPQWVQNITEQRAQASPDVDFPPAMQWARRPIWFSLQNMVIWGLGLPLGILSWAGFLWAGWRLLTQWQQNREECFSHALIWGWTAVYFTWQSIQLNPTMRYQLPIYPTLVIFAAWAIVALYDRGRAAQSESARRGQAMRIAALLIGAAVLFSTAAYAFAFTTIYQRPITRVAASRWIYQNIPGPITLPIQGETGTYNQNLSFPYPQRITPATPFVTSFNPKAAGELSQVILPRVRDENGSGQVITMTVSIAPGSQPDRPLATARLVDDLTPESDPRGKSYTLQLDRPVKLEPGNVYVLQAAIEQPTWVRFNGQATAVFEALPGENTTSFSQTLTTPSTAVRPNTPLMLDFKADRSGWLTELQLSDVDTVSLSNSVQPFSLELQSSGENPEVYTSEAALQINSDGQASLRLNNPFLVNVGDSYQLALQAPLAGSSITLNGLGVATEGDWDDGLPLRIDGYDGYGGIYTPDLNFNMYWDDNAEKLARFERILDEADYITISSNRQWGSLPRLPERFPMTTAYYRNLLGCPPDQSIEYCYRVAEPGRYRGNLGYELAAVFTSEPRLGPLRLNDQFAEEAFTVYDHPKVLIFKKTADYDPQKVRQILGAVDLSKVVRVAPLRAEAHPADLLLPEERWAEQQAGGTWSELFDTQALVNRYPLLAVLAWYFSVFLLGVIVYPLLRLALPGLHDRGYPLARTAGLLLLSYLVWLAGSVRIPFSVNTIGAVMLGLTLFSAYLVFRQKQEIAQELQERRNYFLIIEGLALAFFLAFLLVRLGNPDLWHPWKGGEKPMDFSYFNAVLKSTSFPPYDPWYAGGYLNYYYYGFVLVGSLVKFLGIVPAVAYNLILPTLFSLIALGAFSIAWNLAHAASARRAGVGSGAISPYIPALAASFGVAVLGNQGTIRMIYQGFQRLAAPAGNIESGNILERLAWAVQGFLRVLAGEHLPYSIGDWYWIPSRAIPAPGDVEPITEFPYFTLLYADLHAHLLALPLTLLALAMIVAVVLGQARWRNAAGALSWLGLAALSIGVLRPTNTWDFPTYLALGITAILYAFSRYYRPSQQAMVRLPFLAQISTPVLRWLAALGSAALLVLLCFLFFEPYARWYVLGYTHIDLWLGTHTPLKSYLVHWGLFLLLILSWMGWETRDWLAKTPVSALRRLAPHALTIQVLLALLLLVIVGLTLFGPLVGGERLREIAYSRGLSSLDPLAFLYDPAAKSLVVHIAWFVVPLAAWAGLLLLRRDQPDAKRIVLFLVGSGLVLTLMVEVIVLRGDIGRMNTVFKFYLQVWTLFAISAAAALGWVIPALPDWHPLARRAWQISLAILVMGAAMYTLMATTAKVQDRMAEQAPHTLDGLAYMRYATYVDEWGQMDLGQDERAIRWLQENAAGSPVIVEANLRALYRWGSRFSINTGLPGVVGWEWHQQQQRAAMPGSWVSERIAEVDNFYTTVDLQQVVAFLRKYNVRYIIVGQQERGKYPGPGLEKFEAADGALWREVYREGDTVIYEVPQQR
jgi:YYY domain-containing protein